LGLAFFVLGIEKPPEGGLMDCGRKLNIFYEVSQLAREKSMASLI
jgi:hypothetical protein